MQKPVLGLRAFYATNSLVDFIRGRKILAETFLGQ